MNHLCPHYLNSKTTNYVSCQCAYLNLCRYRNMIFKKAMLIWNTKDTYIAAYACIGMQQKSVNDMQACFYKTESVFHDTVSSCSFCLFIFTFKCISFFLRFAFLFLCNGLEIEHEKLTINAHDE